MLAVSLAAPALKPAAAQLQVNNEAPEASIPDRMSVLQRPRRDYAALGERIGAFRGFPTVDFGEQYNSNIYASKTRIVGDFETTVTPAASLSSDWENHSLGLSASASLHRFSAHVSENATDYSLGASGRADLFSDTYLSVIYNDGLAHEPRTSPDSIGNEKSPIAYRQDSVHATLSHETYRVGLRVEGDVKRYLYQDGMTENGAPIPEKFRDRDDYVVTPRLSYEIAPGYHAFIKAPFNQHRYDTTPTRNSEGGEIDAGTAIDLGKLITAELFAGALRQYYRDPTYHPLSGVSYGGNLLWNFSALDSFKLVLTRNVQETTLPGASADLQTNVQTAIEHELRSDLLVSGGAGYSQDVFQGTSRLDRNFQGSAGIRYLINSSLYLEARGLYQTRRSNADTFDFRQDTISVTLHVQR